jgi:LacI family transcriptional regulator
MGYDDIQLSAFTMPPLSTVSLPRAEIATAAFRALWNANTSEGPRPVMGEDCVVKPRLVVRSSTGPTKRAMPVKKVVAKAAKKR